jgi:hypothetical protein
MIIYPSLGSGRWHTLSLFEQLGNIGSEISRARRWRGVDDQRYDGAVFRALELFDLTIADPRWRQGRRELTRARELFVDALDGGHTYRTTLDDLQRYCDSFALRARLDHEQRR